MPRKHYPPHEPRAYTDPRAGDSWRHGAESRWVVCICCWGDGAMSVRYGAWAKRNNRSRRIAEATVTAAEWLKWASGAWLEHSRPRMRGKRPIVRLASHP